MFLPTIIRRSVIPLGLGVLLTACGPSNYYTEAGSATAETSGDIVAESIRQINAQRVERGLEPLTIEPRLMQSSQFHADYMAYKDCYAHQCPKGPDLTERMEKFHYGNRLRGENIAAGYTSAREAAIGWMNSKGHRENILNPGFNEVGAGYVYNPRDGGRVRWGHYWVMNFGKSVRGLTDSTKPAGGKTAGGGDPVAEVIALVNERRVKMGMKPLTMDPRINEAARLHAAQIGKGGCPDQLCAQVTSLLDRLNATGYPTRSFSMQLSIGQLSSQEVAEQWTADRNEKLMSAGYSDIGVGYYYDPDDKSGQKYGLLWVVYIANPKS